MPFVQRQTVKLRWSLEKKKEKRLQTALNSVGGQIYFKHTSPLLAHNERVKLKQPLSLSAVKGFSQITARSSLCSR